MRFNLNIWLLLSGLIVIYTSLLKDLQTILLFGSKIIMHIYCRFSSTKCKNLPNIPTKCHDSFSNVIGCLEKVIFFFFFLAIDDVCMYHVGTDERNL